MSKNKRRNNQGGQPTQGHQPSATQPQAAAPSNTRRPCATLLWQAVTPLHVGTGQEGTGLVDLPVFREAATGYPSLPASSIKGSYRDGDYGDVANSRFGSLERQGSMTFTDARLFALAVPSYTGTFALVTCHLVMHRLRRDARRLGFRESPSLKPLRPAQGQAIGGKALVRDRRIQLGDYRLPLDDRAGNLVPWADYLFHGIDDTEAKTQMEERLCVVGDDVFSFLCETSLDVSPHVRLNPDTKTVEPGALWWEECIPAESLLTSFAMYDSVEDLDALIEPGVHRIGGKETVGRGLAQVTKMEVAS